MYSKNCFERPRKFAVKMGRKYQVSAQTRWKVVRFCTTVVNRKWRCDCPDHVSFQAGFAVLHLQVWWKVIDDFFCTDWYHSLRGFYSCFSTANNARHSICWNSSPRDMLWHWPLKIMLRKHVFQIIHAIVSKTRLKITHNMSKAFKCLQ